MTRKILDIGKSLSTGKKKLREGPSMAEMKIRLRLDPYSLTKKETEVTLLLLDGRKRDEILSLCSIANNTLKSHIRHVYRKLGVNGRAQLAEKLEKA